ncbi:cyclic nucleotide-binding domain-containing protein [Elusimicrobiota bacterium]
MTKQIKDIEMFKQFPEEELMKLSESIAVKNFKPGDVVFNEGDAGNHLYIIEKGEIEIKKSDKILSIFSTGDIFGEMALFENAPRSADAVANKETTLFLISSPDFKSFIMNNSETGIMFLYKNIKEMSRRLRNTSEYLITIFDTGKIVGMDISLEDMTGQILSRIVEDIHNATGGIILLNNPYMDQYEITSAVDPIVLKEEDAIALVVDVEDEIEQIDDKGALFGVPLMENKRILGYILIEKQGSSNLFTREQKIIISSVANQISLGILNAYNRQEEKARLRLQQSRMWKKF